MNSNINLPSISIEDLLEFHKTHFSEEFKELSATTQSEQNQNEINTSNNNNNDDNDDDDAPLGYYPDGTKRTLTDEDIEYFRKMEKFKRDFKEQEKNRKK